MKYDPIQAFFDGITSTFARGLLAAVAFVAALATLYISQGNSDFRLLAAFPLVAFGVIFAWGASGIYFIFGIASFITFFFLAWRFLDSPQPKLIFVILYLLAYLFFIPLMWDRDFIVWKGILAGLTITVSYLVVAFVLPASFTLFATRKSA